MTTWVLVFAFAGINELLVGRFHTQESCEAARIEILKKEGAGAFPFCLSEYRPLPQEKK